MPDYRKPPLDQASRAEGAPPPEDSLGFSIETTTMRLKSLKLQRIESENRELDQVRAGKGGAAGKTETPAAGRVRHDERGVAVWDLAVATGEFATLSSTNILRKLDTGGLSIEETQRHVKALKPQGRDVGGGGDPYNQRGSGQRPPEAAKRQGITGSADRPRNSVLDQLTGKKE